MVLLWFVDQFLSVMLSAWHQEISVFTAEVHCERSLPGICSLQGGDVMMAIEMAEDNFYDLKWER